ncbi:ergothioneine biosynthesis protein EgtB [Candidatus Pacearchaeota archaeon]|nr:ergothioneine biosynthesis protein EgtB [Candidatus Pacearchaeota archaeon]
MEAKETFEKYERVRKFSMDMVEPISQEEMRIQSMPDVSPPWWNLGHTSWFFARNILRDHGKDTPEDHQYDFLLNSYYNALGDKIARPKRGLISRPTNDEIISYRGSVDKRMKRLYKMLKGEELEKFIELTRIGSEHEQQHQELFFTEIKHIKYQNPKELRVEYTNKKPESFMELGEGLNSTKGLFRVGNIEGGWAWDNEYGVHQKYLESFALSNQLVTNREYMEFMSEGGYENTLLWLDNGWNAKEKGKWNSPMYWYKEDGEWMNWTLQGDRKVNEFEPVSHISFYEADAYSKWKGDRLPTEFEWEVMARLKKQTTEDGNFAESGLFHPRYSKSKHMSDMLGNLWEWTSSHYEPYLGFKEFPGNLSEYNGKFMDNQRVLRGGSCATPKDHIRHSYRNFWPGKTRFQFSGIRLARDL